MFRSQLTLCHCNCLIVYLKWVFFLLIVFVHNQGICCSTKHSSLGAEPFTPQLHAKCPLGKPILIWLNCGGGRDMGREGVICDCLCKCSQTPKARRCLFFSIAFVYKISLFLYLSLGPLLKGCVCGGFVVDKQLVTWVSGPYLGVLRVFLIDSLTSSPCPLSPGPSRLPTLNY